MIEHVAYIDCCVAVVGASGCPFWSHFFGHGVFSLIFVMHWMSQLVACGNYGASTCGLLDFYATYDSVMFCCAVHVVCCCFEVWCCVSCNVRWTDCVVIVITTFSCVFGALPFFVQAQQGLVVLVRSCR